LLTNVFKKLESKNYKISSLRVKSDEGIFRAESYRAHRKQVVGEQNSDVNPKSLLNPKIIEVRSYLLQQFTYRLLVVHTSLLNLESFNVFSFNPNFLRWLISNYAYVLYEKVTLKK